MPRVWGRQAWTLGLLKAGPVCTLRPPLQPTRHPQVGRRPTGSTCPPQGEAARRRRGGGWCISRAVLREAAPPAPRLGFCQLPWSPPSSPAPGPPSGDPSPGLCALAELFPGWMFGPGRAIPTTLPLAQCPPRCRRALASIGNYLSPAPQFKGLGGLPTLLLLVLPGPLPSARAPSPPTVGRLGGLSIGAFLRPVGPGPGG